MKLTKTQETIGRRDATKDAWRRGKERRRREDVERCNPEDNRGERGINALSGVYEADTGTEQTRCDKGRKRLDKDRCTGSSGVMIKARKKRHRQAL